MKDTLFYSGKDIQYDIIKRSRKTVGITVDRDNGVRVLAPFWASRSQIRKIIEGKAPWISKKLAMIETAKRQEKAREFSTGECFRLAGEPYILNVVSHQGKRAGVFADKGILKVSIPASRYAELEEEGALGEAVRGVLLKWFHSAAEQIIGERVGHYSRILSVKPQTMRIKAQKTRWGSCTGNNSINFNWKIATAPPAIIDYLVVHELAHIKEKNHSPGYWKLVETVLPDYRERDKWLKQNGHTLGF